MSKRAFLQVAAVVFSASAAYVSYNLFLKHVHGAVTPSWFDAGCSPAPESRFNCKAALDSPYAYLPFKRAEDPPGKPRLPAAFAGLVHFSILTVWFLGVGAPSRSRRWLHFIPLILVLLGLAFSVIFLYFMFKTLDQWCPWCLLTHVLNFALAVVVILLWPRAPKRAIVTTVAAARAAAAQPVGDARNAGAGRSSGAGDGASTAEELRHPGWRPLLTSIVGCVLAFVACGQLLGKANALQEKNNEAVVCEAARKEIEKIRADAGKLYNNWRLGDAKSVTVRPDDPVRYPGDGKTPTMELVVFSDFQCPSCTKFASFLDKTIEAMFDRKLRVVFKHLPFDTDCNPYLDGSMHEHACFASKLAEAARMTAGNDAFWRVHDFFFAHRDDLERGKLTLEQVCAETKLDAAAIKSKMEDPAIVERIHADIELAKNLEIDGTPAVFVDGKRVERLAAPEIGFWNRLADHYYEMAQIPRPPSTIPQRKVVVPKQGPAAPATGTAPPPSEPRP